MRSELLLINSDWIQVKNYKYSKKPTYISHTAI